MQISHKKDASVFKIRASDPGDTTDILSLWHQGWHEAHGHLVPQEILKFRTPDYFKLWFEQSDGPFWIAADDHVLGFVTTNGTELEKLFVAPRARGKGVAKALLSYGERVLQDNGVTEAELFCTVGNTRAERFYSREGWHIGKTSQEDLWLPEPDAGRLTVNTHVFRKVLGNG